jgi:hypothetical protein
MRRVRKDRLDFDLVVIPRLRSLGRKPPTKIEHLADPIVACYASQLSKDWYGIYNCALLATQIILRRLIFRPRHDLLGNMSETLAATPLREKKGQIEAYRKLSEVLRKSVAWLNEKNSFLLKEILRYAALYDQVDLRPPGSIQQVRQAKPGERNWTIYQWESPFVAVAKLVGPSPKGQVVSIDNFPPEFQPYGAGKEPLIEMFKVPGAKFSRFEVWHKAEKRIGKQEDPWFALQFLGETLDRSRVVRLRIQKFSPLRDQILTGEDMEDWWTWAAKEFSGLDIGRFVVETEEAAEEFARTEDLMIPLAHLSKWVTRKGL